MKCPSCGASIPQDSVQCAYCGTYIDHPEPKQDDLEQKKQAENAAKMAAQEQAAQRRAAQDQAAQHARVLRAKKIAILIVVLVFFGGFMMLGVISGLIGLFAQSVRTNDRKVKVTTEAAKQENPNKALQNKSKLEVQLQGIDIENQTVAIDYYGNVFEKISVQNPDFFTYVASEYGDGSALIGQNIYIETDGTAAITKLAFVAPQYIWIDQLEDGRNVVAVIDQGIQPEYMIISSQMNLDMETVYYGGMIYPEMQPYCMDDTYHKSNYFVEDCIEEKVCTEIEASYPHGETITEYKFKVNGRWYITTKWVYEALNEGDSIYDCEVVTKPDSVSYITNYKPQS